MRIYNSYFLSCFILTLFPLANLWAEDADLAAKTAIVHAGDEPVASPAATTAPTARVNSRAAIYTTIDGQKVEGWLAWPAGKEMGSSPGLIIIHEWWGLNENIKQTSERLAAEGYVTLAVDLYRGETAEIPKTAMKLMQSLNAEAEAGVGNLAAAYDYLHNTMGLEKVGIVGWCLGGRWSLQAALFMPDAIDAMVMYYGSVVTDKAQLATLQMPVMGNFAENDPIIPLNEVTEFSATLDALGKTADIKIYEGAKHAFSNTSGLAYDPVAANDAWMRSTKFLAQYLGNPE